MHIIAYVILLGALGGALFYRQAMLECRDFLHLQPQNGKIFVVTGGNSGLGFETSKALAASGGTVVMACRSMNRCNSAKDTIVREFPGADIVTLQLNLASFASVNKFANDFKARYDHLDVLVNNAGIMAVPTRELTEDGLESQIGTNHFGHFLLTSLLFPIMAKNGRVINHSSEMHRSPVKDFPMSDIQSTKGYGAWAAYGNSKMANVLFTYELNNRLAAIGNPKNIISIAVHPGYSNTNLQTGRFPLADYSNTLFAMSQADGALAQINAAAGDDVHKSVNNYYGPKYFMFGAPGELATDQRTWNRDAQARLWADSLRVIGGKSCFVA